MLIIQLVGVFMSSGCPDHRCIGFCDSLDFVVQVFQALVIFHLASQGLLLVGSENRLNVRLELGRKRLKFVILLILLRHAFGSCEHQSDKTCLLTKEEIDVLGEEVHFCLLLVEK